MPGFLFAGLWVGHYSDAPFISSYPFLNLYVLKRTRHTMLKQPLTTSIFRLLLAVSLLGALPATATELRVKNGEKIQDAVNKANPGDTIVVEPGSYHESVSIDKPYITLKGLVENGKRPVLKGEMVLPDGVIASGDHFRMTGFRAQDYKGNGVTVQGAKNVYLADLDIDHAGLYGIYPVNCTGVVVENTRTTRVADAGLYVGQSRDILVRNNVVTESVMGIEIENSENAVVENNLVINNTGGILAYMLPGLKEKTGNTTRILRNFVINNNLKNFADPKSNVAKVPPGTGILILAFDTSVVAENIITGNGSFGVAVVDMEMMDDPARDKEIEPHSDQVRVEENFYMDNGAKPAGMVKVMSTKGADVIVMSRGKGHCVNKTPGMVLMGDAKTLPACAGDRDTFMREALQQSWEAYTQRMAARLALTHTTAQPHLGFDMEHPPAGTHVVKIQNMTYSPMHLEVKKGEKVVWVNMDGAAHTVTSSKGGTDLDPAGPLQSPIMDKGHVFEHTFQSRGKFIYLCLPHIAQAPMRDATVTVK